MQTAKLKQVDAAAQDAGKFRLIGLTRAYCTDQQICGEGGGAGLVFKVLSGTVRAMHGLAGGRRQISAFYLPGDGFGVALADCRPSRAEAVCPTTLVVTRQPVLLTNRDGPVEANVWRLAAADPRRIHPLQLTLEERTASERLASFLVGMADRIGAEPAFELPMPWLDIADHLGLSVETVWRTFTALQRCSLIALTGPKRVRLLDRAALEMLGQ